MAQQNAKALRDHLARSNADVTEQVAELNLRGVSAVNRNDLRTANADFRKAYELDPNNAFTLNNIGYVAEIEGDRETAQFFYERARQAGGANATVGVATRRTEEGRKLFAVAADSNSKGRGQGYARAAMPCAARHEPVVLRRRDNSIVDESASAAGPIANNQPQHSRSQGRLRITLLEAPDIRFGIVKDVAQKVGQVAR